jgi:interferon gamma-inducible protein 30
VQESVLVEFFEEALCPYCAQFSTKILGPLLRSNLTPYIDFNLVPYGNAKKTSKA